MLPGRLARVSKKDTFKKEYDPSWSTEIFIVDQVMRTNPITYKLKDLAGEDITGGFYTAELQHVT